jgi:hypothetical protein
VAADFEAGDGDVGGGDAELGCVSPVCGWMSLVTIKCAREARTGRNEKRGKDAKSGVSRGEYTKRRRGD